MQLALTDTPTTASGAEAPTSLTPLGLVLRHYTFPFEAAPLQVDAINDLAPLRNSGGWMDMATGKTFMSTVCALYRVITENARVVVIVPPNLIVQWAVWLRSIKPAPSVTPYHGTPKQRSKLSLRSTFVIVGIQVFKRDYERFYNEYGNDLRVVIIDEATMVANIDSANHEACYEFSLGHTVMPLSGTPINKPGDGYGLLKFSAPGTYRSKKHFENTHVLERDFYDMPIKWQNLDQLEAAMLINSKRILYSDMYPDADKPLYMPLNYELHPDHEKLYRRLVNDEMLKLPDGGKIDASTANRLRHALGQIVVNWNHFAGNPDLFSEAAVMVDQKLQEMGTGKLVIFADYKMTVRNLVIALGDYGAVGYNSEISAAQKERNKQRFIEDPTCRVIVVQFISGSKGLDGFQHVCNWCMFIEPCQQPRDFHQAIRRLLRPGQKKRVGVILLIAQRTLQLQGFKKLIENDTLVNTVIRNASDLKTELLGIGNDISINCDAL
jgi:hypothetical protein